MMDLDELLKLKAAARGRFYLEGNVLHAMSGRVAYVYPHNPYSAENGAYIVAACNAVPELIKRVRELERQRELLGLALGRAMTCNGCGLKKSCLDYNDDVVLEVGICASRFVEWAEQAAKEAGECP